MELNERLGIFKDIGDKKAVEKTSQALREGQPEICQQQYKDEKQRFIDAKSGREKLSVTNMNITAEGYFGYSVQVLEALYYEDENDLPTSAQLPTAQS